MSRCGKSIDLCARLAGGGRGAGNQIHTLSDTNVNQYKQRFFCFAVFVEMCGLRWNHTDLDLDQKGSLWFVYSLLNETYITETPWFNQVCLQGEVITNKRTPYVPWLAVLHDDLTPVTGYNTFSPPLPPTDLSAVWFKRDNIISKGLLQLNIFKSIC